MPSPKRPAGPPERRYPGPPQLDAEIRAEVYREIVERLMDTHPDILTRAIIDVAPEGVFTEAEVLVHLEHLEHDEKL